MYIQETGIKRGTKISIIRFILKRKDVCPFRWHNYWWNVRFEIKTRQIFFYYYRIIIEIDFEISDSCSNDKKLIFVFEQASHFDCRFYLICELDMSIVYLLRMLLIRK